MDPLAAMDRPAPQPEPPALRPDAAGDGLRPWEAAERQRALLVRLVRATFLVLFTTVTLLAILKTENTSGQREIDLAISWPITVSVAVAIAVIVVLVDVLTPSKKIATLFSVFVGLAAAMITTVAFGFVFDLLAATYDITDRAIIATVKVLFGIALAYLGISIVLQTRDDFRLAIPYVEFAKQIRGPRPLLLDSSALIDARIVDVAQTGVLQAPIVIPRFVVGELQLMADAGERMRRARGRRGLDVIARLQRSGVPDVSVDETPVPGKAVDQMLVELARAMPAVIVTTDTGLARVAAIQGVRTLNLNDLANALKPSLIPGERLTLRLIRAGEQPGQGVGYLDDGTMVIAEDGHDRVGQTVTLSVTSTLQTSAGRLIFGRLLADPPGPVEPGPATEPPDAAFPLAQPPQPEASQAFDAGEPAGEPPAPRPRGPFPPKPPRERAAGSPRNPRR